MEGLHTNVRQNYHHGSMGDNQTSQTGLRVSTDQNTHLTQVEEPPSQSPGKSLKDYVIKIAKVTVIFLASPFIVGLSVLVCPVVQGVKEYVFLDKSLTEVTDWHKVPIKALSGLAGILAAASLVNIPRGIWRGLKVAFTMGKNVVQDAPRMMEGVSEIVLDTEGDNTE